jgi:hypothetical protein
MRRLNRWLGLGFWTAIFLFPEDSIAQSPYYKGKTITVIEGRTPGGVGDLRIKAIIAPSVAGVASLLLSLGRARMLSSGRI